MMRRVAVVVVLVLAVGCWPAAIAVAHSWTAQASPPRSLQADFNNDGADDLAIGAPGEGVGAAAGAGAVTVVYGSGAGLSGPGSQLFTQAGSAPETDDQFGAALAGGDFNEDGFADLAVAAPLEDVGGTVDAGAVSVLYGSAGGLTTTGSQLFTQVGSAPEPNDQFGFALAAGDFNNDGADDLAAGAPFEAVGASRPAAGALSVLYGSGAGLTTVGGQLFTQVAGAVETDDVFGFALAAGDFNNDTFADLAAGAPFEDVGTTFDAGAVSVLYGSGAGLTTVGGQLFTQVAGTVEAVDLFGDALAAGDFNNDGFADLAVGAPFEDVGNTLGAGAVSVLYGSAGGLTAIGGQLFTQVGGNPETFDEFGDALTAGDFNNDGFADLAAGAPFESVGNIVGAGAVSVLYGSAGRLTTTGGQLFTQDTAGIAGVAEAEDHFGAALATGDANPPPAPASPSTANPKLRKARSR